MKSEHEKLKWIADKIEYDNWIRRYAFIYVVPDIWFIRAEDMKTRADVREIIFTEEFTNKLVLYLDIKLKKDYPEVRNILFEIFNHLDNPVQYLYNLIKD